MTVVIEMPASEPEIRRPEGDPGAVAELAATLSRVSARFGEFAGEAQAARFVPGWYGIAWDAYAAAAGRAADQHERLSSALARVARVVEASADTLRDLQHECDGLVDEKHRLDQQRHDLACDVESAGPADPAEIEALRDRAASLRAAYLRLVHDHDALRRRVRANEELLARAFRRTDTLAESLADDGGVDPLARRAMDRSGAPGRGASPQEVQAWWDGLSEAEREAVVAAYPRLVGSADGLPAAVRDDANRVCLADDLARLEQLETDGFLSEEQARVLANARAAEQALGNADAFEDPTTGERPGGQLWLYDPSAFGGDGQIAIGVGDLDSADDVALRVPGITNDGRDAVQLTEEAMNVYTSARFAGDGSSVASMMWLGYDAPDAFDDDATLSEGRAEDGGGRLANAIDGLRASRPGDPAHLTAIGHSYGSTTVAHAATDHHIDSDDIVLVGSPGAGGGVGDASELGVGAHHVWVGRNSEDLVAALGDHGWVGGHTLLGAGLGDDPSEDDFGANRFQAEDVTRSGWHRGIGQHGNYFNPDTESLYNIGRIVDGQGDQVNLAEHTYDPWYGPPQDPETDRDPTAGVPGESQTRPRS